MRPAADGADLSGQPSTGRAARAGGPSVPAQAPTSGAGKEPPFSANDVARLFHVVSDPRHRTALERANRLLSRAELEKEPTGLWTSALAPAYNATSYCPTTPNLIDGIMDVDLRGMNPNRHSGPRDPSKLEAQFRTLRSLYTVALSNYTRSGNNEPIFKRCVRGDHRLLYIHCLLKGNAATDFVLRTVSPAVQCEVGLSCSKQVGTPSSSGRKRPRAAEVSIEGMSGLTSALSSVVHCMGAGSAPRTAAADIFDNAEAIGAVRKQLRDAQEDLAADPLDETTASVIWHLKRQLAALMK